MNDLISRQAAIDIVDDLNSPDWYMEWGAEARKRLVDLPAMQPFERRNTMTKERTETHACDLIERETARRIIESPRSKEQMLRMLEATPSAQPEQRWIPCSERMPGENEWVGTKKFGTTISDEVYVTFENPKSERFCKHISFQNGKLNRFDQLTIDAFYKGSKPIAWMPLPEPWKGEENDDPE